MVSEEISSDYSMCDGEVISFFLDFSEPRTATVCLKGKSWFEEEKT